MSTCPLLISHPGHLHQYSLIWVATLSATFHAKFLDQRLITKLTLQYLTLPTLPYITIQYLHYQNYPTLPYITNIITISGINQYQWYQ